MDHTELSYIDEWISMPFILPLGYRQTNKNNVAYDFKDKGGDFQSPRAVYRI